MKTNLKKLGISSVMVALSTVLSLVTIWKMPLGGSVTLLSMVPIILVSYLLGTKWGIASAFVNALLQLALGIMIDGVLGWGLTPLSLTGTIFLDYLVPFTLLGFAGLFAKKGRIGQYAGAVLVIVIRFICHLVSGAIIFDIWCPWKRIWLYSFCYNGAYMLPELIITTVALILLVESGALKRIEKFVKYE